MEPISTATILTGLAINFASQIIINGVKSLQETGVDHDLGLAYNKALKEWSSSSQLRHQKEHLSGQKLRELQQYLNGENVSCDDNTLQFIRIFRKEICDKKYQSLFNYINLQLQERQVGILNEINDRQEPFLNAQIPELRTFAKPKNYIDRTISGYSNSSSLIEIIKNEHAVALLGEGGLGKTTELDNIASILSIEGWYCGLVRLINYADSLDKLIESQFEHWQNIPTSSKVLILLDGLDEVSSSNISKAENEIVGLTRIHKNVHFLISYRNSYSLFLSLNNEKDEVKEISRVTLDPVSEEFVKKYINDFALEPSIVTEQFQKQNLLEICKNPFYLVNYIEIINKTGKVPDNKSDFFEKILSIRFQSEQQKGSEVTREVRRRERTLRKKLEALALTMQLAGKYQIENNNIQEIFDDPDLLDTTRRIVLYESGISDAAHWRFEHNNFQEYLAAKKLSQCSWEQMQSILFLPNKKLKPKWYNAISFLINQLDPESDQHNQLIKWLNENDRVAFIKLEVVHLDLAIRNQVFYSIYNYYKEKEIVFYAEFSGRRLAKFSDLVNNQELIDFLCRELNSEIKIQNLYNIVDLFYSIVPQNSDNINRIANSFLVYLRSEKFNDYNINAEILDIFIQWKWGDEKVLKETISSNHLVEEGRVRSSLIRFQIEMNSPFITAEFIIRCLQIRKKDKMHSIDMFTIGDAIFKLSGNDMKVLLNHLIQDKEGENIYFEDYEFQELLKSIEKHISNLFIETKEQTIILLVEDLLTLALEKAEYEAAKALKPFFKKCEIVFPRFVEAFNSEKAKNKNSKRNVYELSAFIADEPCIDWILSKYKNGDEIIDEDIKDLSFAMSITQNYEIVNLLWNKFNVLTNNKFIPKPPKFEVALKKSQKLFAHAILNQSVYIDFVDKAFKHLGKDEISKEEFWSIFSRSNIYESALLTTYRECLRNYVKKEGITYKQEVASMLTNSEQWLGVQLEEHLKLSNSDQIPEENLQWIINWCTKTEKEIDIKSTYIENGKSYLSKNMFFIEFCLNVNYRPASKSILLDMISCLATWPRSQRKSNSGKGNVTIYEYLLESLTKDEINENILKNIKQGILVDIVLDEHINIIDRENLNEAVSFLPKYINDDKWDLWTRLRALKTYFRFGGNTNEVKILLEEIDLNAAYDHVWNIVDEFSIQDKQLTASKLVPLINNQTINHYKLSLALIKCGRKEGLDILIKVLDRDEAIYETYEMVTGAIEKYIIEGEFVPENILPFLIDVVFVYLKGKSKNEKHGRFPFYCFKLLSHYLEKDIEKWPDIESKLSTALNDAKGNDYYVTFYHLFQELQLKMNVHMDSECEIDIAIKKLTEVGIVV